MKAWTIRGVHLASVVIFLKKKKIQNINPPTSTVHPNGRALPLSLQFQAELMDRTKAS